MQSWRGVHQLWNKQIQQEKIQTPSPKQSDLPKKDIHGTPARNGHSLAKLFVLFLGRFSLKWIQKYSIYNQFQKQLRKGNLMFGFESINAPQLYFYFLPTGYYLPAPVTPQSESKRQTVETLSHYTPEPLPTDEIILTLQDLLQEGYDQTKKPWSKEEDRLLLRLCRNEQARFQEIAGQIQGRNAKMCYSRFRRLSYQTKAAWTQEEDQRLLALVDEHGEEQWKHFEPLFKGRTHKQIRDHFENHLRPDVNRSEWSVEQDLQLIALINTHGKDWRKIEERLPGRSRNQIKNRFFGKICRLNARKRAQVEKIEVSQH